MNTNTRMPVAVPPADLHAMDATASAPSAQANTRIALFSRIELRRTAALLEARGESAAAARCLELAADTSIGMPMGGAA